MWRWLAILSTWRAQPWLGSSAGGVRMAEPEERLMDAAPYWSGFFAPFLAPFAAPLTVFLVFLAAFRTPCLAVL